MNLLHAICIKALLVGHVGIIYIYKEVSNISKQVLTSKIFRFSIGNYIISQDMF